MIRKIFFIALSLIFAVCCMENPTPEELGIELSIKTDKLFYTPGEPIEITITNFSTGEVRIVETLVKEGKSISYEKSPLFFVQVLQPDGTWKVAKPYESRHGAQFPYHMRAAESMSWTSKKMSSTFAGNKIKLILNYKDQANRHSFVAESEIIEIKDNKL